MTIVVVVIVLNFNFIPGNGWISDLHADDQIKQQIFNETTEALQRAKAENVSLLSPNNFANANKYYQLALEDYEKGETLKKIHENLNHSMRFLDAAFEATELSKIILAPLINMREQVLNMNVQEFVFNELSDAEQTFRQAANKIEEGNINAAKSMVKKGEEKYRKVVLNAVERMVLAPERKRIKKDKSVLSKEDYALAMSKVIQLEKLIEVHRKNPFEVNEFLNQAKQTISVSADTWFQGNQTSAELLAANGGNGQNFSDVPIDPLQPSDPHLKSPKKCPDLVIKDMFFVPVAEMNDEFLLKWFDLHVVVKNIGTLEAKNFIVEVISDAPRTEYDHVFMDPTSGSHLAGPGIKSLGPNAEIELVWKKVAMDAPRNGADFYIAIVDHPTRPPSFGNVEEGPTIAAEKNNVMGIPAPRE